MIRTATLKKLKLTDEQIEAVSDLQYKESRLRELLVKCDISPRVIEKIMMKANAEAIDLTNEQGLIEQIREQFGELVIKKG